MQQPGRKFNAGSGYRYGFNGQQKSDEIKGEGNSYTAEFWEYDPRLGRRWNLDPKPIIGISPYSAFLNNPIFNSDEYGDTVVINLFGKDDRPSFHAAANAAAERVKNQPKDGIFLVFAHANSDGLQYSDPNKAKPQFASTTAEINTVLNDKTEGEWNKALANKDKLPVTLVVNACNFASNDFYDEHFNQGVIHRDKSAAQRVSKDLDITVFAPDGYALFNRDPAKPSVIGFHNQDGDAGLLKIQKGEILAKKRIEKTTPTVHAIGNKRGLITGILKKQIIKKK